MYLNTLVYHIKIVIKYTYSKLYSILAYDFIG